MPPNFTFIVETNLKKTLKNGLNTYNLWRHIK